MKIADEPLVQADQDGLANGIESMTGEMRTNGRGKTPEKNGKTQQEADLQLSPLFQSEEYENDEIGNKNDKLGTETSPGIKKFTY